MYLACICFWSGKWLVGQLSVVASFALLFCFVQILLYLYRFSHFDSNIIAEGQLFGCFRFLHLPLTFTANTFAIALILSLSLRGERGNLIPRDLRANVANLDPNSNKHFAALLFSRDVLKLALYSVTILLFDSNKRVL